MADGGIPRPGSEGGVTGGAGEDPTVVDRRFFEFHRTRDRKLRNELVVEHEPLARQLARRFRNRGETLDDLTQVALLGLLKAVERYDPGVGVAFAGFAAPTILGELRRHFRDKGWAMRVPRRMQELNLAIGGALGALEQELGRNPTVAEVAESIDADVDEVLRAMEAAHAYRATSVDALTTADGDGPGLDHVTALGEEDAGIERVEDRLTVATLLRILPDREREIFRLRFERNMTQSQIAAEMGMSQMHVSRLLAAGIARLRSHLVASSGAG